MASIQPLLTSKLLQDLVDASRASGPARDGAVWRRLLANSRTSESQLADALLEWQGVATILDGDWCRITLVRSAIARDELPLAAVRLDQQLLLLTEDPWAAAAIDGLAGHSGATLALARIGQIEALRSAPVSALSKPTATASMTDHGSSPVVDFVEAAIMGAYDEGASDIHFETDRTGVGVKYRLDGVMAVGPRLDEIQRAEEVISRIKVMAQLDITERRRPQDGRIHWTHPEGHPIDLRVSIMPSLFGEDAVLRLLDKAQLRHAAQRISLDALGFDSNMAGSIRSLASRPHGMLLITGPTGSGKTTTLYAALSEVNDGLEKIVTIEDPVEYELPGILQIPVNEKKGLTFATGLRSILRHDPDKILVGEIRDAETAEIAVQSALTGHTVFTTVHANSVFDVLGRFQHFGIDPFALASALNGVVVQRLLRRLCPHCATKRASTDSDTERLAAVDLPVLRELPVAVGCDHCRGSGYRGRFVLAEIHQLSDSMRDLIVSKSSMTQLKDAVYAQPERRLLASAMRKVGEGVTTLEEVSRVVGVA
jgi:general secretion pathway protein E